MIGTAVVINSEQGHTARLAHDQVPALGVETHAECLAKVAVLDALVDGVEVERVGAVAAVGVALSPRGGADDGVGVVALGLHRLIDGEDAREAGVGAPVGHVAGVGAHLVEARTVDGVELDVAVRYAVAVDLVLPLLDDVARGIEQLHVQHPAKVGETATVRPHHVGLEPHRLALEITRVVEMEIDLLLWHFLVEQHRLVDVAEDADSVLHLIRDLQRLLSVGADTQAEENP